MRGTMKRIAGAIVALALGAGAANMALARPGLYIGAGSASTTASGGFDGTTTLVDDPNTTTLMYLAGKLDAGSGLGYLVGFGFNRFLSVEYVAGSTSHKASHVVGNQKNDATADIGFAGARFNLPLGEKFELFARAGLNQTSVTMKDFSATGTGSSAANTFNPTAISTETFKGSGQSVGVGFEYYFKRLGIGFSQTAHSVDFKTVKGAGTTASIDPPLKTTLNQSLVTLTLNFKGSK
jgi:hypothetical protein